MTLIIDSIQLGKKIYKLNIQRSLDINFESDFIPIKDNLYIKIFIARNQEYGKKFYSWKWDYLKKIGSDYSSLGVSYYGPMEYNQQIRADYSNGQGMGEEGKSDYFMIYYRYKLE